MRPLTGFSKRALAYSFLSGVFLAAPNVDIADGLLGVVIRKDLEALRLLDELVNLKSGAHIDDDNVMYAQGQTVSIKSKVRDVTVHWMENQ
jgi:diacylglycerol kinase family enzyme